MIPITRQDILAHQAIVPWVAQYQVEQDLLLCRAMVALFDDKFLNSQIAMRGGTLLHKVHLAPAARYSEDIDLVVVGNPSSRSHSSSDSSGPGRGPGNAKNLRLEHTRVGNSQHRQAVARVADYLLHTLNHRAEPDVRNRCRSERD